MIAPAFFSTKAFHTSSAAKTQPCEQVLPRRRKNALCILSSAGPQIIFTGCSIRAKHFFTLECSHCRSALRADSAVGLGEPSDIAQLDKADLPWLLDPKHRQSPPPSAQTHAAKFHVIESQPVIWHRPHHTGHCRKFTDKLSSNDQPRAISSVG